MFLIAGAIHAFATFYWSFGGEIGLLTVGQRAVDLKELYGYKLLIGLFLLGVFKLCATWMPLLLNTRNHKLLKIISYIGALILIVHGGGNTLIGWLKFLNIIPRKNTLSQIGQAFIWDPLFLIWDIGLLIFLRTIKHPKERAIR